MTKFQHTCKDSFFFNTTYNFIMVIIHAIHYKICTLFPNHDQITCIIFFFVLHIDWVEFCAKKKNLLKRKSFANFTHEIACGIFLASSTSYSINTKSCNIQNKIYHRIKLASFFFNLILLFIQSMFKNNVRFFLARYDSFFDIYLYFI